MDNYTYKQSEKKNNKYIYEVKVSYAYFQKFEDSAFAIESKKVKLPGFRPGHAPKHLVEKEVATKILTRAINNLLPAIASEVVTKENLNPMHELHYDLKEFDKDKDIVFTFELYAQPEIKIEDFKKLSVKYDEPKVNDEEVESVVKNMIRNSLGEEKLKPHLKKDKVEDKGKGEGRDDELDFDITEDMVKELKYEDATTLEEVKKKVSEAMFEIKKQQYENEYVNKVVEQALKMVEIELPEHLLEDEVFRKEEDFRNRLSKIKLDVDNYLNTQGTTIEKMREDWKKEAMNQVSSDLLLINLAVGEKNIPTEEEVDVEIEKISNPQIKAQYKERRNKDYFRTLMTRDRGLSKLLEIAKK